ncbi:8961_t:CDS:2 [Paraglomus brasilianum]|uniref:8961_t:CDS:1 n=1 Tax=Paraglomus brasilianum TaxID=144538 RepID=A0A9N9DHT1_9GLOM|nr:8961_t:CDS:2 [Paraglomus brasilianum]
MAKVRTLQDTKSVESKKIQGQGYRLGSTREQELEEALRDSIKSNSEITSEYKNMQVVYSNHSKNTNKENDQLRRNNEKLSKHVYQLIDEVKRLRPKIDTLKSRITDKDLSLAESKAENVTKSKKIRSLESMIKILEGKLSSAQKDAFSIQNNSTKKESEILSLKSKIAEVEHELASKVSELECLKSEAISAELARPKPVVGGDVEKNIIKGHRVHCSADSDLSKYFIRGKNTLCEEQTRSDISPEISSISNSDRFEKPLLRKPEGSGTTAMDRKSETLSPLKATVVLVLLAGSSHTVARFDPRYWFFTFRSNQEK